MAVKRSRSSRFKAVVRKGRKVYVLTAKAKAAAKKKKKR